MSERQAILKAGCKKHGLDVPGKDPLHQVTTWENITIIIDTFLSLLYYYHHPPPSSDHHDHQVNPWEYFINRERKFVWCNVFKSASSSWMYGFNNVAIR